MAVFDKDNKWIGTKPLHIGDKVVKSLNPTSNKLILSLLEENEDLKLELSKFHHKSDDSKKIKDDMPEKKADKPEKKKKKK